MDFRRFRDALRETNAALFAMHSADLDRKAADLKRAVEEGWFKYVLLGGALAGAALGLSENETLKYLGYGMLLETVVCGGLVYSCPRNRE